MTGPRRFSVKSIGTVRRENVPPPDEGEFYDPFQETVLEIDPGWESALAGLEGFSHLVVIFFLDQAKRPRKPGPARAAEDWAEANPVGLFATRTPRRPNPIGLSCPRLIRREGNRLIVSGIDAWPGTPILDIKGYYPRDEQRLDATVPDWLTSLWEKHDQERGSRPK
jgi:tRNA-Thr(GGU) m(6)t(6)A37 methyltransferase TsaA